MTHTITNIRYSTRSSLSWSDPDPHPALPTTVTFTDADLALDADDLTDPSYVHHRIVKTLEYEGWLVVSYDYNGKTVVENFGLWHLLVHNLLLLKRDEDFDYTVLYAVAELAGLFQLEPGRLARGRLEFPRYVNGKTLQTETVNG